MNKRKTVLTSAMMASLLIGALSIPAFAAEKKHTLTQAVPGDVFLCITGYHNPEREFLDVYWNDVLGELKASGIGDDVMELFGTLLDEEGQNEAKRLKDLGTKLLNGVDFDDLVGKEMVFAERMATPTFDNNNVDMGPPDLVWIFRGSSAGAAKNFDGIVAILETVIQEICKAANTTPLTINKTDKDGTRIASVNLTEQADGAPVIMVNIAVKNDTIVVAMGQKIFDEVMGFLSGKNPDKAISNNPRYKSAFAQLPPAEDATVFVDIQNLLKPIRSLVNFGMKEAQAKAEVVNDIVLNSSSTGEAHELTVQAWKLYEQKDYKAGLELTTKAHELAPADSAILYYMSCFHALNGNKDKSLDFLEKAVDAGFYKPQHISWDPDLKSLHEEQRFKVALEKATKLAKQHSVSEEPNWKALVDRLMDIPGIFDYIASVEYTDGYSTKAEAVVMLVADARSKPFYPVFAKPKKATQFDRYLPAETLSFDVSSAVDLGGLYKFLLDTIRCTGPKGEEALVKWEQLQQSANFNVEKDILDWVAGDSIMVELEDNQGWVMLLRVHNEELAREKVTTAVDFVSKAIMEAAQENPVMGMFAMRTSPANHDTLKGFQYLFFGMSPQPVVWGVADNHLIFGSSTDAICMCLDTAQGKHPNIRKNARVMSEALVPDGMFTSVSLTDQRQLGNQLAAGIGMFSMMSGMLTMAIPDPEVRPVISKIAGILGKLTPVVTKINFYKSVARQSTFNGQSWHSKTVTHYVSPDERPKKPAPITPEPETAPAPVTTPS